MQVCAPITSECTGAVRVEGKWKLTLGRGGPEGWRRVQVLVIGTTVIILLV